MRRDDIHTRCATSPNDRTRVTVITEAGLDELLSAVDKAERFGQSLSEGQQASRLASHGNGGETSG